MTTWYFADRSGQQQGPVSTDALIAKRTSGELNWQTLVWRDGMADWQPMSALASELGAQPSAPPMPPQATPSSAPASSVWAVEGAQQPSASPVAAPSAPAVQPDVVTPAPASDGGYSMYGAATPVKADPRSGWDQVPAPESPYSAPRAPTPAASAEYASYAGFWKRFAAAFIDGLVVGVPVFAIAMLAGFSYLGDRDMINLIVFLVGWPYYAYMESHGGQTLGKKALGIRVTNLEGDEISFGRATARYFSKFLSALILYIGYIMAAFTARKQALHDMIASTLVLED